MNLRILALFTLLCLTTLVLVLEVGGATVGGSADNGRHSHGHDEDDDDDDEPCVKRGEKCKDDDDCCDGIGCNFLGWSYLIEKLCLDVPKQKLVLYK